MSGIAIHKFTTAHPGDVSALKSLPESTKPEDLLAVIGKTEGNGCVNDFTRMLSSTVWDPHLEASGGISVFSGGTEGVLSPHVSLVVKEDDYLNEDGSKMYNEGLVAKVGGTRDFEPWEMGTAIQAKVTADTIKKLISEVEVEPDDVHMVLVKCPLLTTAKVVASAKECVTTDTYKSMGYSRLATAVGIALALGEVTEDGIDDALESYGQRGWSSRASCSSGAELENCHIVILASSKKASNPYRAVHGYMADAIDLNVLLELTSKIPRGAKRVQIFVKAEPSTDGVVRGKRHTMMTDSDIQGTRHARAAVGGLVAGVWGETDVYVSGGAEGQGPMGGGSVCVVYKV
ncbi:cyanuric acid hydrolase/Barbiturase [Lipomyces chichibuensis]|uniref:cyanuric acid hydrolase/Barbiturase n=1 Tax=Lipomyces chichibuensis TaxID=1546026 RepID=UPI0033434B34